MNTRSRFPNHRILPAALTLLLALVCTAWIGAAAPDDHRVVPTANSPSDVAQGETEPPAAFGEFCSRCHNADGSPTRIGVRFEARDLAGPEVRGLGAEGIRAAVREGRERMPARTPEELSEEALDEIIGHILALPAADAPPADDASPENEPDGEEPSSAPTADEPTSAPTTTE